MLTAVRDQLRTVCSFTDLECEARNDPQPLPTMGKRYIGVYPGECRGGPHSDQGIQEYIGVNVGITIRLSGTPSDRIGQDLYLKALVGMEALSRKVQLAVHRNYDVMGAANTIIGAAVDTISPSFTSQKFITPLEWQYTTPVPEVKLGDWFLTDNENEIAKKHGLYVDIRFAGAHRPQQLLMMR